MSETIGFVGLGSMGLPMAANIQRKLFVTSGEATSRFSDPLRVFNRTVAKTASLQEAGCKVSSSLSELASECTIVHLMLSDDTSLLTTANDLLSGAPKSRLSVLINHSTTSPSSAAELSKLCAAKGVAFVPCPVLGRPDRAEAGQLGVIVSGTPDTVWERVAPVVECFSTWKVKLGGGVKEANVFKLVVNFHLPVAMEMFSEAFCVLEKNNIDKKHLLDLYPFLLGRALPGYANAIAAGDFAPNMSVSNGIKDVGLILDLAKDSAVRLPLAEMARDRLNEAAAKGRKDYDWAVMATVVREENGLPSGL